LDQTSSIGYGYNIVSSLPFFPPQDFFGFAPGKIVGLKYSWRVEVTSIEANDQGEVERIVVTAFPLDASVKPKTSVQWVSTHLNVPIEVSC
jgi:hypothetical protein